MTSVLAAEYLTGSEGIGRLMMRSAYGYDIQVFMAGAFIVISMLLIMFLVFDIISILASAAHPVQREFKSGSTVKLRAKMRTNVNRESFARLLRSYGRSRIGMIALAAFIVILAISLLAPLLATVEDTRFTGGTDFAEPSLSPSPTTGIIHPLGTDHLGRDVYSMLLYDSMESVSLVLMMAGFTLLVGVSFGIAGEFLRNLNGRIARSVGWIGWIFADVLLATMILVSSMFALFVILIIAEPLSVFMIMILGWMIAPFLKAEVARTLLSVPTSNDDNEVAPITLSVMIARSLHISKFVVLFGYLSFVMAELLLGFGEIELGWADTIADAYMVGALISGYWWLVLPQAIMIGLVAGLSYLIIDRAERVFEEWQGSGVYVGQSPDAADYPMSLSDE